MPILSSVQIKIVDDNGVFLGVANVPSQYFNELDDTRRPVVRCWKQPPELRFWSPLHDLNMETVKLEFFVLVPSCRQPDAYTLFCIQPEELSAEPGFAFLPSVEYLRRSASAQPKVQRETIKPGPHLEAAREVS